MTNEEIIKAIRSGRRELMADLYENNKKFIFAVVKYIGIQPNDYEDAMQDAYFGLYEAVNGFDTDKGYKFLTYAKYHIQTAIQRGYNNTLHVPEYIRDTARKIKQVRNNLTTVLGRTPTAAELSDNTGFDIQTLNYTLNAVKPVKSIYEPLDGDMDNLTIADSIEDESITFEEDIAAADERRIVHSLIKELPEAERKAIWLYYLQSIPIKEIARRLRITPIEARCLINKGLRLLRKPELLQRLLEDEVDRRTDFYNPRGLNAFKTTWTSATEQTVIRREYLENEIILAAENKGGYTGF